MADRDLNPVSGYLLLRGVVEAELQKRREQEMRQAAAQQAARELAGVMPLLALLNLAESSDSPAEEVSIAKPHRVQRQPG